MKQVKIHPGNEPWKTVGTGIIQLSGTEFGFSPILKTFQAADGNLIQYTADRMISKASLQLEIHGADVLQEALRFLQYGEIVLENIFIPNEAAPDTSGLVSNIGTRAYVDGDISLQTVSYSQHIQTLSVPIRLQIGGLPLPLVPFFFMVFSGGGSSTQGIIIADADGTQKTILPAINGKRLPDGSVQLPTYTADAEETAAKVVYVKFGGAYDLMADGYGLSEENSILIDGVNGKSEPIEKVGGTSITVTGLGVKGSVTDCTFRFKRTLGGLIASETLYRLRILAPGYKEEDV